MYFYIYVVAACHRRCRRRCRLPPPILIVPLPVRFAVLEVDMLSEALAPLHRRGVAEPELLLGGVGGVRAHAADED